MYRRQACTKLGIVVSCACAGMVVATILKQHQVCLYVNIQFCIKFQLAIYLCRSETRVVVMSVAIFSSNFHCVHYIRTCAVCVCFSVHMCMHIAFLTPVILLAQWQSMAQCKSVQEVIHVMIFIPSASCTSFLYCRQAQSTRHCQEQLYHAV